MRRNDLTPYMPALPATAADLKGGKQLTLVDRVSLMLEVDDTYQKVKAHEEACNGHGPTCATSMFNRAFAAKEVINIAMESGDQIIGGLTPVEADRALTFAKRRHGISLRQRRRQAIANQAAQQALSDVPVGFK